MRNVSDKSCRGNQNTHFVFSNFFSENGALYELRWKNILDRGRSQMTIWRMRISCWVPKATNTYSENALLIDFPLQHLWHKISSMLTLVRTLPVLLKHIFNKQWMTSEVLCSLLGCEEQVMTDNYLLLNTEYAYVEFDQVCSLAVCWTWYIVKVGRGVAQSLWWLVTE